MASVKLRALLALLPQLMEKSIRNKSVMTALQSADLRQGSVHGSLHAAGWKAVLPSSSDMLIWSFIASSFALALVLRYAQHHLTHVTHLWHRSAWSISICKRSTWENTLVCLCHLKGKRARGSNKLPIHCPGITTVG